jgi:uncharacterized protein (DUF1501 family)
MSGSSDVMLSGGRAMSRREALHLGLGGAAGLLLAGSGGVRAYGAPVAARARSVIQIWLWGGPCHIDTFDPKPGAGYDYCGALDKAIGTNVAGIQLNELFPQLAKLADKYTLIRGMTHGINSHETAAYTVQTGHASGGGLVYPSIGAVVSLFKGYEAGYKGLIPPYVVLTELQGRFSECGFLGARYKPFATGGDPAKTPFAVEGVVAEGLTPERQRSRRGLMRNLDSLGRLHAGSDRIAALAKCEDEAYDMILGDAGKIFDLGTEKPEVRERYGKSTFGQSCLMARRLVELGVPYVTINFKGWDTHKQHFQAMRQKLPDLDRGLGTLLADLSDRGLLGRTVVWCGGEFGHTPKVQWDPPWNGGRNHFGAVFSTLVAGGGFRGGQVVGSSDAKGMEVASRPVRPQDLIGSVYELLGIDPNGQLQHPLGQKVAILPAESGAGQGAGRLREIMA